MHSLRTGEPGFVAAHDGGLWQYLESHPEAAAVFHGAMGKSAESRGDTFAAGFDFSGIRRLVDVGGGDGALIQAVLEAPPHVRAVAFDVPGALAGAERRLAAAGLAERCELVPGDFFDAVPAGGDAYVLSYVIHDWQDREALRILSNVRRAVDEGGRLLLIKIVLPED